MKPDLLNHRLRNALQRVGWIDHAADPSPLFAGPSPLLASVEQCLLRRLLALAPPEPILTQDGRHRIRQLIHAGWTLRASWPRTWNECAENWLGPRCYFGHASRLGPAVHLTCITSSQTGRYGRALPQWPRYIEAALRHIKRDNSRVLVCPGTTFGESVDQYCLTAGVPRLMACWDEALEFEQWFSSQIVNAALEAHPGVAHDRLFISPALQEVRHPLAATPLQDRFAIGLADRAYCLRIRPGGNLARLVAARLSELSFPSGTVFLALEHSSAASKRRQAAHWLARGAVGWILQADRPYKNSNLIGCHRSNPSARWLHQISCAVPVAWHALHAQSAWPFLVHCTRGLCGPLPEESLQSFRNRIWTTGDCIEEQPLETLARICREQCLRATSTITRTNARCVSFTSVPLVPLLHRRKFQSHLNRWDWEPYGLVIRQSALWSQGAKPVVYGRESDFQELEQEQQPYFQPAYRRNPAADDWSNEREWRVLGDIRLNLLSPDSILAFVKTRDEAQQLARHSPWPVLWIE